MGSKEIKVILLPGYEVTLRSDAPDIAGLVSTIVEVKDELLPDNITVECEYKEFDKTSFKEILVDATTDFVDAIRLDKKKYEEAIASLKAASKEAAESEKGALTGDHNSHG